jgi:hypothetical protein
MSLNSTKRSIHSIKTGSLEVASKEIGLEVNAEKTKYMVIPGDQTARQNQNIKIDNNSFAWVEQFIYLETTLTNQNSILKKLRTDSSQGMLAVIRCRILCLPVCYPEI